MTRPSARDVLSLVAVAALLAIGVPTWGPTFAGAPGYLASGGGVAVGLAVGIGTGLRRWPLLSTVAAAAVAYLLCGGAFALPMTAIAGFVPTLDTLARLTVLTVFAWRDLLTVSVPADSFTGPAVVPYLTGLVTAVVAARLALGRRWWAWAVLPAAANLAVAILWGTREAPLAVWLGLAFAVVALGWAAWRTAAARRTDAVVLIGGTPVAAAGRRAALGASVLAGGTAVALLAAPVLGAGINRQVLRDDVVPPFDPLAHASPLTSFRHFETDAKDAVQFRVQGLPEGVRLRLATLDAYDGVVFGVADTTSAFVRVGRTLAGPGDPLRLHVTADEYAGLWVASAGDLRGLEFVGPDAARQAEGLVYNPATGTVATAAGVRAGDAWAVAAVPPVADATQAAGRRVLPMPLAAVTGVPDALGPATLDIVGDATQPYEQVRRIAERLHTTGFYSDGTDGRSRAGHTTERLATMLAAPMLVGDDEQYAALMTLMVRQLGLPARVVLGFYPDAGAQLAPDGSLPLTGRNAHVWVEVPFEGLGWVAFDPAPNRDRVPLTEVPKPKPTPQPRVLPPPDPPHDPARAPVENEAEQPRPKDIDALAILLRVLAVTGVTLGVLGLLAGPFVLIAALKKRRRASRRGALPLVRRLDGGWAELEDAALDLGTRPPRSSTRLEAASVLDAAHPGVGARPLAAAVEAGVFAPQEPSEAQADAVWQDVDAALVSLTTGLGRWRRWRARFSPRSLLSRSRPWGRFRAGGR